MATLHNFVCARLADLTNAGGLTVRAGDLTERTRDVCRTVVSAAVSARNTPQPMAAAAPQPRRIVVGHDLPLLSPGVERC